MADLEQIHFRLNEIHSDVKELRDYQREINGTVKQNQTRISELGKWQDYHTGKHDKDKEFDKWKTLLMSLIGGGGSGVAIFAAAKMVGL